MSSGSEVCHICLTYRPAAEVNFQTLKETIITTEVTGWLLTSIMLYKIDITIKVGPLLRVAVSTYTICP